MEVLKKTTSVVASLMLCASFSYANWKTSADSQVAVQTRTPTSLQTSLTSSFSGGGARVAWRNLGSLSIINAQAPKFNVGCNGIEVGFGSISFLDFDNLVNKLKMIASQAPAFAFKMALDTACSQCSTILQDLEEIVEAINNFSLDSCAIAENLGNSIGSSLSSASDTRYEDSAAALKSRTEDKGLYNKNKIVDTINAWTDTVTVKGEKLEQLKGYGSFLNNLRIKKIPSINGYDPKEFIEIIRALVGDVVGYVDEKNDYEDTYFVIPPSGQNIDDLVSLLVGEKDGIFTAYKVVLIGNDSSWDEVNLSSMPKGAEVTFDKTAISIQDSTATSSTPTANKSWTLNIEESIDLIVNKFKGSTAPTAADLTYLQNLPFNGYRVVNYFAMTGGDNATLTSHEYAKYVALVNAKVQLTLLLDLASNSISEYIADTKKINSNNTQAAKYEELHKRILAQKTALQKNSSLAKIPDYVVKIKQLILEDASRNRIEKVQ